MEISGKIKVINPEQQVSASFRKRELVVTTEEQYPQHISIDFTQDKCDLLNSFKPGQFVVVAINLTGREWVNPQGETKYFNTIKGWNIKLDSQHAGNQIPQPTPQPAAKANEPEKNSAFTEEEHDDLPF